MKENIKPEKIFSIPNILSMIRILLVPVFAILYFVKVKDHYLYAALVLLLSGASDVLDGIIARKFNMITAFGKLLDPLADKLTQAVVVICLAVNHNELIPVLVLLLAKEFSMLLGAVRLLKMGLRPSESKWWGKLSTVMLYVMFVVALLSDIVAGIPSVVIIVFAVLASICLLFSLFNYYPIFKEIQNGEYDIETEKKVEHTAGK